MGQLRRALAQPAWVCFTWLGMTAGVSVLSTLARFSAPTVAREVAIDIGRVTFAALNKAELVALIVLLVVVRFSNRARRWWGICALLTLILIAQSAWLLPELSARADMIVAGIEPPPSKLHTTYSVLELGKLALLLLAGFIALGERSPAHRAGSK